tara:strand:+ start:108 stop:323 length:216 start_codon:yes stop_codon:yes gene_type:complete
MLELRGFDKVHLKPGQSREVEFALEAKDLAYYSGTDGDWVPGSQNGTVRIGNSSGVTPLALSLASSESVLA